MLGVDGVELPIGGGGGEQWGNKKLREAIEGTVEMVRAAIEVVVGRFHVRVGVGGTAMLVEVLIVLVFVGELFRAQEEHLYVYVRVRV